MRRSPQTTAGRQLIRLEPYFASLGRRRVRFLSQPAEVKMTKKDIQDAIAFLERQFVGVGEQDRLFEVIAALKEELTRRSKK